MDDKDWLILKQIAKDKNITKAAENLFMSQPAVTYRIKSMENDFGAKIFLRTPNGVLFTPQGEYLLKYAEEMLQRQLVVKEIVQNMGNDVQGRLHLGSSAIFAHYELPQILSAFLAQYPKVDIDLKTGLSLKVDKMLQQGEVPIAIIRGDYKWPEEKLLLFEEPLCLVYKEHIEIESLPETTQVDYMTDSSLKPLISDWWREHFSKPPAKTMVVDSMDTCRQMVIHGLGWAILPKVGLAEGGKKLHIQNLAWASGEPLVRKTWLMFTKKSLELSTIKAFVAFMQEYYKNKKI